MQKITAVEFLEIQLQLGWSNEQTAAFFVKTSQTISNWRTGSQSVPMYVNRLLNGLVEKHGSLKKAGAALREELQVTYDTRGSTKG